MEKKILFENDDFFVIDKSFGVLSEDLIGEYGIPRLTHRLDKDTSGVMVLGKSEIEIDKLQKLFKSRNVKKVYLALVHGKTPSSGVIRASIGRSKGLKRGIDLFGRKAVTRYKVKKYFKDFSLLECYPETGRTHQVRVHLKSIGHPVAGDKFYKFKRQKNPLGLERQFLHALLIEFLDFKFEVELAKDLQNVLDKLE